MAELTNEQVFEIKRSLQKAKGFISKVQDSVSYNELTGGTLGFLDNARMALNDAWIKAEGVLTEHELKDDSDDIAGER